MNSIKYVFKCFVAAILKAHTGNLGAYIHPQFVVILIINSSVTPDWL